MAGAEVGGKRIAFCMSNFFFWRTSWYRIDGQLLNYNRYILFVTATVSVIDWPHVVADFFLLRGDYDEVSPGFCPRAGHLIVWGQ